MQDDALFLTDYVTLLHHHVMAESIAVRSLLTFIYNPLNFRFMSKASSQDLSFQLLTDFLLSNTMPVEPLKCKVTACRFQLVMKLSNHL